MAVEARRATPATLVPASPSPSFLRLALLATAATLGLSGAATAAVSMLAGLLVYQYARARGQWGTDEPPDGLAEEVSFRSAADNVRISGWFFTAGGSERGPAIVLCHGIWTGRRECLPLALRFRAAGYNVLCFDFRAHGLSDGRFTSVGHHETNDVIGAVEYLLERVEVDSTRIRTAASVRLTALDRPSVASTTKLFAISGVTVGVRRASWFSTASAA